MDYEQAKKTATKYTKELRKGQTWKPWYFNQEWSMSSGWAIQSKDFYTKGERVYKKKIVGKEIEINLGDFLTLGITILIVGIAFGYFWAFKAYGG